jgi:hypothetical protein
VGGEGDVLRLVKILITLNSKLIMKINWKLGSFISEDFIEFFPRADYEDGIQATMLPFKLDGSIDEN